MKASIRTVAACAAVVISAVVAQDALAFNGWTGKGEEALKTAPKFADSTLRWTYLEDTTPPEITTPEMVSLIEKSLAQVSSVCGIKAEFVGTSILGKTENDDRSSRSVAMSKMGYERQITVVGWNDLVSSGFGWTAAFASPTFSYFKWNEKLQKKAIVIEGGTVQINPFTISIQNKFPAPKTRDELHGIILHEMMHIVGLNHSDDTTSIMSDKPYNPNAYNRTLRSDDILGCQYLYGPAKKSVTKGWNLLGNGFSQKIDVATAYSDAAKVQSVWKWDAVRSTWQFFTPSLSADELKTYAEGKGYGVLSEIAAGEGFWINVKDSYDVVLGGGLPVDFNATTAPLLRSGWNLIAATADTTEYASWLHTPSKLSTATGLKTLWSWDSASSRWMFHAPELARSGTLSQYAKDKGYREFDGAAPLDRAAGVWVNR